MKEPRLVKIGYCTDTEAKLLAVFYPDNALSVARIAYGTADGHPGQKDVNLDPVPPYLEARFELTDLPPSSALKYRIVAGSQNSPLPDSADLLKVDSGKTSQFRLLPSDRPLRIALVSCNKIMYASDERQHILWRSLKEQVDEGNVDMIIHAGDQIYADHIREFVKSDPSKRSWKPQNQRAVEYIARRYREFYMKIWGAKETSAVLASCPSVMIWDDHDVYDGWGSHDDDDTDLAQTIFQGADRAFHEFQACTNPPLLDPQDSYACGFVFNGIGVLVLDTRKNRSYKNNRVMGEAQLFAVEKWLDSVKDKALKYLYVVSSIPFVHVNIGGILSLLEFTPWTEEITDDIRDCWVSKGNRLECRRILNRLFTFWKASPHTQVTVLGGDIHVSSLAKIESKLSLHQVKDRGIPRFYQIVSSGIGHTPPKGIKGFLLKKASGFKVGLVQNEDIEGELIKLASVPGDPHLLDQRNYAIIKVENKDGDNWDPYGNLQVEYFADEGGRVERYDQVLLRT
jgi:phosphodiesterase/alkaline phosphatase D-like protein